MQAEVFYNLIGAFWVIALYSFVFKETRLFRFAEHAYIGISAAVALVAAWKTIYDNVVSPLTSGVVIALIPLLLGITILSRLVPKYAWVSRVAFGIVVGSTLGLQARIIIESNVINQIMPILSKPLFTSNLLTTIENLIIFFGILGSVLYFYFTPTLFPKPIQKSVDYLGKFGRYVIVGMLGAQFGNTVMGRASMFIERIYFVTQSILAVFGIII
jgi:hypothetical protein